MPVYKYVAKNIKGQTVRATQDAANTEALLTLLHERSLFLVSYEAVSSTGRGRRFKAKELAEFNRELGTMLSSGITLLRALEIMLRRDIPPHQRQVFGRIHTALLSGVALSSAMEEQGGVFPQLLINMYRAGEANGTMDVTALQMAEHYEKEHRLQSKIKSAMTYPIILMVMTVGIVILLFTVVLPMMGDMFEGMDLPPITRAVMFISRLFTDYLLYTILVIVGVVAGIQLLLRVPRVRVAFDRFKLRMPVFGKMMRTIATARFARTLSSLYASGLSILTALEITRGTVGNAYIATQFDELVNNVRTGNSLSDALDKVDGFDKKLAATVLVGEESGRLDVMLKNVADSFDYEAAEASQRMVSILEPVMIAVMAIIVAMIMIAVLLPMYGMYSNTSDGYI